jgi:hypothetical protein
MTAAAVSSQVDSIAKSRPVEFIDTLFGQPPFSDAARGSCRPR